MKTLKQILIAGLMLLYGCQVGPKPIDYGRDGCHFCKMTIVDNRHAAEIVTKKGKVYKFDATECMIRFVEEFDTSTVHLFLSNDYSNPGSLINTHTATFLISENIPSPMGAFLSAFASEEKARETRDLKTGDLFTWNELLNRFNQ